MSDLDDFDQCIRILFPISVCFRQFVIHYLSEFYFRFPFVLYNSAYTTYPNFISDFRLFYTICYTLLIQILFPISVCSIQFGIHFLSEFYFRFPFVLYNSLYTSYLNFISDFRLFYTIRYTFLIRILFPNFVGSA
jgi:hypothetical protein